MVFSSIVFLLYFLPLVFLVYYAFSFSRRLQNIWLLAASLIFYAWGEPIYVLIMLASIFMNWIFGLLLLRFPKEEGAEAYPALLLRLQSRPFGSL